MYDLRLSRVIDSMRLPLVYVVVMAHLLPFTFKEVSLPDTSNELYTLISEMFSYHIGRIPVGCFFLVSGYFFFTKYADNLLQFGFSQLKNKPGRLLVLFFACNIIMLLAILLKNFIFVYSGLRNDVAYPYFSETSMFQLLWSSPINFPLWYVRHLMCMILIFPIIFYFIKLFKHYAIITLGMLYLGVIEPGIPGFSMTAIFFFSAGAYFSIYKGDILDLFDRVKVVSILLMIAFLVLSLLANGETNQEYFMRVFLIAGVVSLVNLFAYLESRDLLPPACSV